ncbi:MAG: hypothetical protein ACK55I_30400, partial [bacterium]
MRPRAGLLLLEGRRRRQRAGARRRGPPLVGAPPKYRVGRSGPRTATVFKSDRATVRSACSPPRVRVALTSAHIPLSMEACRRSLAPLSYGPAPSTPPHAPLHPGRGPRRARPRGRHSLGRRPDAAGHAVQ